MPAEQLDLFGQPGAVIEAPRPPPAAPPATSQPSDLEPDWDALRQAARGTQLLAALDGLRDHDGHIKNAHRMLETRRLSNPPVPPAWADKYKGLLSDRAQAVKSMIGLAAIPYLNGLIALRLETARFMRRSPAVLAATSGIEPLTDHAVIDGAIGDVFNQAMPSYLYVQAGTDAAAPYVQAQAFERELIAWQNDESRASHARLIAALEKSDDLAGMRAAAADYLKIALRLAWAKMPVEE